MTVRSITQSYEHSSESGREGHVTIPWARLKDVTPTLGDPAAVSCVTAGQELTGTVVRAGTTTTDEYVELNVADGAAYRHNVRNVLTYDGANNEATWGAINIGDTVYYDETADANTAGVCKLSTSPLQGDAATANPIFGKIVMLQEQTAASFPTVATALSDVYCVVQAGQCES